MKEWKVSIQTTNGCINYRKKTDDLYKYIQDIFKNNILNLNCNGEEIFVQTSRIVFIRAKSA